MNESSVTQNRKKRKISDALDESPMTHFGRVFMENNDLATAENERSVTFRTWGLGGRPKRINHPEIKSNKNHYCYYFYEKSVATPRCGRYCFVGVRGGSPADLLG